MSARQRNLIIGTGTVAFFGIVLFAVIPYQIRVPGGLPFAALSPAFWPTTVTIMGMTVGLLIALRGLLNAPDDVGEETAGDPDEPPREEWRAIAAMVVMFGYLGLIHLIGIVAASIAVVVVLAALFTEQRHWWVALVAVIVPIALYLFFTRIVRIPLPLGVFEQLL